MMKTSWSYCEVKDAVINALANKNTGKLYNLACEVPLFFEEAIDEIESEMNIEIERTWCTWNKEEEDEETFWNALD